MKDIEALINMYDTGDENAEYIDEMKPSINKSLQQLQYKLTESHAYKKLLETNISIPPEIFLKQKKD